MYDYMAHMEVGVRENVSNLIARSLACSLAHSLTHPPTHPFDKGEARSSAVTLE